MQRRKPHDVSEGQRRLGGAIVGDSARDSGVGVEGLQTVLWQRERVGEWKR